MAFEGYTSATSVLPGGSIDFHLDSDAAADFTVRIFRVANANPVMLSDGGHVVPQTSPAQPWENGADFDVAYSAQIGADWPSGIYRAQFDIGNSSYGSTSSDCFRPKRSAIGSMRTSRRLELWTVQPIVSIGISRSVRTASSRSHSRAPVPAA